MINGVVFLSCVAIILFFYKGSLCVTTEITKDVKLVGYDFRGHTRGTLVVGIAYGCSYYKGSAILHLFF